MYYKANQGPWWYYEKEAVIKDPTGQVIASLADTPEETRKGNGMLMSAANELRSTLEYLLATDDEDGKRYARARLEWLFETERDT